MSDHNEFLEDARERQVLRTVGPVYQFRQARLQDRLTSLTSTTTWPEHSRDNFEEADRLGASRRFQ